VLCNRNNKQEGEVALVTPSKGHVLLLQEGFSLSLWVIVALCFFCNKDNKHASAFFFALALFLIVSDCF